MIGAIAHRGPDDAGEFLDDRVQIAAVRLSIVDLKGGHQPVSGCDDRTIAVQNGEIYNYAPLRAELRQRGHRILDTCDTSVLPHLYEELGPELVRRLRGMFAIALWDSAAGRLVLARDRLGIKPLYFARTPDYLLFGSEAKALLASGLVDPGLDPDSIDDLFSLSYPCPPRSMFRDVFELRPGHLLVSSASGGPGAPKRYWRAPFRPRGEHLRGGREELEAEYRDRLQRTVYGHLMSDVPVATYLSGGLDSSAISALVKEVTGDPPTTYSIGFSDERFDETTFSAQVARALGAPNERVVCDESTALELPDMIWHTELPLQFPLALPMMRLSARARASGFPVVLTGEGADETLAGYDCFRIDRLRRLFDHAGLRAFRPLAYRRLYRWAGSPTGLAELLLDVEARPAAEIAREFGGVYPSWYHLWQMLDLERTPLLAARGRRVRPTWEAPSGWNELVRDDIAELHPVDAALALELETRLPSWILLIGDRASMAHGVEARVPFLDHELVEFAVALPPSFKLRGLREKSVLRAAMAGRLPEAIRTRQKRPFYTPLAAWFFGDARPDYVEELLGERALREAGWFEPAVVARLRRGLAEAPPGSLLRMRLEWLLILVLGVQLLQRRFVDEHARYAAPPASRPTAH
jgi:asparagine synthase (glutamine-hydrolysing)